MSIELKKYRNVDNTVLNMYALVNEFYSDPRLAVFDNWSLQKIFDYISKTIPYVPDPVPGQVAFLKGDAVEALKSPIQTMYNGGDCDDKSILAACIFERKKIPYRFAVVSTKPDKQLHHVYLEIMHGGKWLPFDPTYKHYKIFWENPFTKKKIYQYTGNSLRTREIVPQNTNCRSCTQYNCLKSSLKNNNSALLGSNGNAQQLNGNGVQLAILKGADNSLNTSCNCGGPCCNKHKKPRTNSAADRRIIKTGQTLLLGNALNCILGQQLGEPITTTVATVLTVVSSLFGGLFKKEAYQDAYNAWSQAESQLVSLSAAADRGDKNALAALSVNRAIIAILSRDYMNKPLGADVCTSAGRCGNRAEWLKIQPEVEAKAAAFAPMMQFINAEAVKTRSVPMGLTDLVGYYDQFKSKSGFWYDAFTKSMQKPGSTKKTGAGGLQFSGAGLLLLAAAVGVAFKLKSKK